MTGQNDLEFLKVAVHVAWQARERGNHPFWALLVGPLTVEGA